MVRAAVVLVVTVSLVRVVWVQLGVQVGLEDVGVLGDTDEAEVATRARSRDRSGRCEL